MARMHAKKESEKKRDKAEIKRDISIVIPDALREKDSVRAKEVQRMEE